MSWVFPCPGRYLAARVRLAPLLVGWIGGTACATPGLPPPEAAAREFAAAAERGDAATLHRLLTSAAQREFGPEGTRQRVEEARAELAAAGAALAEAPLEVDTLAVVRFADGERAELTIEEGQYRIALADVLPTRASTPEAALAALRVALARRSYPALSRLLSAETRAAVERDLALVVEGLAHVDALEVQVEGDRATVKLDGGFVVQMQREDGIWRVEGID